MEVREIEIDRITVSAQNTRKKLDAGQEDSSLEDLANSIREKGLLSPIVVRIIGAGTYKLIAGQRRLLACRKLAMHSIPAIVRTDLDDTDAAAISLIENVHRADMDPLDKARAFQQLSEHYGGDLRRGIGSYRSTPGGFQPHSFCILILQLASSPLIQGGSRMRRSARTDLCGGRSVTIVPTASIWPRIPARIPINPFTNVSGQ